MPATASGAGGAGSGARGRGARGGAPSTGRDPTGRTHQSVRRSNHGDRSIGRPRACTCASSCPSAGHAAPLSAGNAAVPVQAACVLGIYGGDDSHMQLDEAACRLADERAITVALAGAWAWAAADGR